MAHAEYEIKPVKSLNSQTAVQTGNIPKKAQASLKTQILPEKRYSQAEIDNLLVGTAHEAILRVLIKCESQNTNVARMDSNGVMSYGILQFNGHATWDEFAPLAGVSGTPMNPYAAVEVADWMIDHGQLHRWTCAKILGMI